MAVDATRGIKNVVGIIVSARGGTESCDLAERGTCNRAVRGRISAAFGCGRGVRNVYSSVRNPSPQSLDTSWLGEAEHLRLEPE